MQKPLIIITGKDGQLGFELSQIQNQFSYQFDFLFGIFHRIISNFHPHILALKSS
jgi:hypothetical protein